MEIWNRLKIPRYTSRGRLYASMGNFMTHPLRLYPRKLSGRIDYSHIDRGSVYWKRGSAIWDRSTMKRSREFNDDVAYPISSPANGARHPIPFPFVDRRSLWNFSFSRKTCLSWNQSSFFISRIWKRHVFRISFCRNELRLRFAGGLCATL